MKHTSRNHPVSHYSLVCGMEIHAELKTKSKMFCGCKNDPFGAKQPNSHTCPVCLGMPGGIPVANKKAIEWTIKLGLALGCKINLFSKFDRKHYFYPDLAKGYQISQYDLPFCYNGLVETSEGPVRIRRIHLEEDTGKLQHKTITKNAKLGAKDNKRQKVSLIDFNRSGVPLVEIVTEADIQSAKQAKEYGKKIRSILRFLDIADCDMEQGGMRLEANVSLRLNSEPNPVGVIQDETNLPKYKVELKNINSFRFLEQAIDFEMHRQASILESGTYPAQETRGWDSLKSESFSQRTKEDAEDYRYFPDPDLPPLRFTQQQITTWQSEIPPLAEEYISTWQTQFGVDCKYSQILTDDVATARNFQTALELLQAESSNRDTVKHKANLLANMLVNKKLPFTLLHNPQELLRSFILATQVDSIDPDELATISKQVVQENPEVIEKFKAGKTQVIGFLLGQTMKKITKKVDPKIVTKAIIDAIQAR